MSRLRLRALLLTGSIFLGAGCSGGDTTLADPAEAAVDAGAVSISPTTASAATTAPAQTVAPTTMMPATSAAPDTTVAVPVGVVPGQEWAIGELPDGVDELVLDDAVDVAFGAAESPSRVRSIVLVRGGEIVYERYHPLDTADTVMESFSVAKSFTSAVIGLLVGDGLLEVDAPAPVAAWSDPDDPRHAITVENLLHMASGLDWSEVYAAGQPPLLMLQSAVASDYVSSLPLEANPGEKFEYSTGTTAILAGIITDTLGGPEAATAYIEERLLRPLGITSTKFLRDGSGRWLGGIGADSTTRDFARFGLLFLNDGVWGGKQILPEGWVEYSRAPSPTNPEYGAQWWMRGGSTFEANGLFGQLIRMVPDDDLVIAINATQGGDSYTLATAVQTAFADV